MFAVYRCIGLQYHFPARYFQCYDLMSSHFKYKVVVLVTLISAGVSYVVCVVASTKASYNNPLSFLQAVL